MRTWIWIIIGLISYIPAQANGPVQSNFFKGSVEDARSKASQEGKLFLLDFYADWCTPCNWMKETTYTDDTVLALLKNDYVAIKVNIDDLEGFNLKERYQVKYLPTILIFNSQSQLLLRVEETLSPSQMIQALKKYNVEEHKIAIRHDVNISPTESSVSLQDQLDITDSTSMSKTPGVESNSIKTQDKNEAKPDISPDSSTVNTIIQAKIQEIQSLKKDDYLKLNLKEDADIGSIESANHIPELKASEVKQKEVETANENESEETNENNAVSKAIANEPNASNKESDKELPQEKISMRIEQDQDLDHKLGNFKYTKKITKKYRLQVGVYSKFTNTYKIVNDLKSKFADPVIVLNDSINGKVMYRVFLGEFYEVGEAETFQKMILSKYNLQSVIK